MRIFAQLLVISVAIVVSVAAPSAYAGGISVFNLTLTENSSASLSLSYNGPSGPQAFTVKNTAPDQWTITIDPNSFVSLNNFDYFWQEPEDTINQANEVLHSTVTNPDTIFVYSDVLFDAFPNNTAAPVPVGSDDESGLISLTFNDLGDATAPTNGVPDTGSTVGMLLLSAVALFGLRQVRTHRFA